MKNRLHHLKLKYPAWVRIKKSKIKQVMRIVAEHRRDYYLCSSGIDINNNIVSWNNYYYNKKSFIFHKNYIFFNYYGMYSGAILIFKECLPYVVEMSEEIPLYDMYNINDIQTNPFLENTLYNCIIKKKFQCCWNFPKTIKNRIINYIMDMYNDKIIYKIETWVCLKNQDSYLIPRSDFNATIHICTFNTKEDAMMWRLKNSCSAEKIQLQEYYKL